MAFLESFDWIWACDSSLELSCYKNDHIMGEIRFARAARPQCAKMCSAHYIKMEMRGPIWPCDTSLEPSWHPHEHLMDARPPTHAARPQCAKMCFFTT